MANQEIQASVSEGAGKQDKHDHYIPGLDGIRAIALLLVFAAHAGLGSIVPGGFGVTVFFFLSGYLITTLLRVEAQKKGSISLRNFYIRRAFRILPPLYITLAIAFLMGALGLLKEPGTWDGLVASLLYSNNYYGLLSSTIFMPTGMEVVWSLAVEEHFYFVFPFVYLWFIRGKVAVKTQVWILASACVAALAWRCVLVFALHIPLEISHPWTYIATDCRFDSILMGSLLAIRNNPMLQDPSPVLKRFKGSLAILGLAGILLSLALRDPHYRESLRYTQQSLCLYPIFYFCMSTPQSWPVKVLEWTPLRWIGWLSYSLYLIHFVLLGHFSDYTFQNQPWKSGIAAVVCAFAYAVVMRQVVELPLRRLRDQVIRRNKLRSVTA